MDIPSTKRYAGAEKEYVLDTQALLRYCSGSRLGQKTLERVVRILQEAGHHDTIPSTCHDMSPEIRLAILALVGDRRRP
eukprot:2766077-Lingulodinium_polyedra.AAC.1